MHRRFALSICALGFIASCGEIAADRVVVGGTGSEEFLNMRAGPGLGFRVVLGLPDGTVLNRKTCVTELGQLWCEVSLDGASGVTGYVSADYLTALPTT